MPSLNWIGKADVNNYIEEIPTHLLRCDRELSHGDPAFDLSPGTGNILVEGDNLLALQALLPYYRGQVKCICIDPPYNTGNEHWIYNDNVNSPQMRQWLGKAVDSEDLCRHDKWLCMMQARLHFHHQLLREDGTIFICIDDNEVHHLRSLCDEIFGASNFISNVVWQKSFSPNNSAKHFSEDHDHILVYAKNSNCWQPVLLQRGEQQQARYKNTDNDERGPWTSSDLTARNFYSLGTYFVTSPAGKRYDPPRGRFWSVSEDNFQKLDSENRIWWGKDGSSMPRLKRFLSDVKDGVTPQTIWPHTEVGNTQEAKKELLSILSDLKDVFITPKPTRLIERILQIATNPGDIVLDSFAGSGTTGHTVLKMNAANPTLAPRRFISVELEQEIARPITRERLKRAIDGYGKHEALGGGFRFCFLGETLLDAEGNLNPNASWRDLAHFLYLQKFGSPPDAALFNQGTGFIGKGAGASLFLLFKDGAVAPLDTSAFRRLDDFGGPKIVYCDCICVPHPLLERAQISAFQTPYEVTR